MSSTVPSVSRISRRAHITEQGLHNASESVLKVLNHDAMVQCFPELLPVFKRVYGDEEGRIQFDRLVTSLKEILISSYREGIPLAWKDMCESFDWVNKADRLDEIVDRARKQKEKGSKPQNMYAKGADGRLTIPSATLPVLREATLQLKAKRQALEEKNNTSYGTIVQDQVDLNRTEKQIKEIIADFNKAMETLSNIDLEGLIELQDSVVRALPADAMI